MGGSEWKKEGQSGEWQLKMGSCQERRGQGAGGGGVTCVRANGWDTGLTRT